jgi:hypothetical protein
MKKLLFFITLFSSICNIYAQTKCYLTSAAGEPFGSSSNITAMNQAFGVGNWSQYNFQTVNTNALLQPTTCFIYMDGSGANATALGSYLISNLSAIENWVFAGGKLFLNAGPSIGSNINFGFGGTTCNYPGTSNTCTNAVGQINHPIFSTPFPSGNSFSGSPFSYAFISGGSSTAVATGTSGSILTELVWGSGRVMFGGMNLASFQNPNPQTVNFRADILVYLAGNSVPIASSNASVMCSGQAATLTASGIAGATYSWIPANQTGSVIVVTPSTTTNYTVIGTPTLGCNVNANISLTVNPLPSLSVTAGGTICAGGQTATLTASGANTYSWSTGSTSLSIIVTPTVNSTYTVYGTYSLTGCTNNATASIEVSPCTGLEHLSTINSQLKIFPNPTNGEFIIELENDQIKNIQIIDLTGRPVVSFFSEKEKITVKTDQLSAGIYYIKVQASNITEVLKLIKQ